MKRGYSPRLSTVHLMAEIMELPGIATVRTLPPTSRRPTMLRITLDNWQRTYSEFTIKDAREWLASEK